jgi:penicillin-binding protein 1B
MPALRRRRRAKAERRAARSSRRWLRVVLRVLPWAALVAGALVVAELFWVDRAVVSRFEERTRTLPSRVYAAPYTLFRGARLDARGLQAQLDRLGYAAVVRAPARPGEYRRQGNRWELFLREAETPAGRRPAQAVTVESWWGRVRRIRERRTSVYLDEISLEAEPLFTFYDEVQEEREWTPLARIPPLLVEAVEAIEDRRFRDHHGVDPVGIGRALWANVRAGGAVQGGSTITQQLVKNLLGPGSRSLSRKALEAAGAVMLELHYDKGKILEAYLNEVYLGQTGPVAISGVGQGASFFFGRTVEELDLPRCALLAGIIRNPGRYQPWRDPAEARERRDLVLRLMRDQGRIDAAVYESARAAPLGVHPRGVSPGRHPWLEDLLAQEVRRISPEALPARAGFSIFTTFDPEAQRAAEVALRDGLERLDGRLGRRDGEPVEGALVALRPRDGALLAAVGGRDHGRSQFHRAVDSRRPPGSTFKPFVYLAALERAAVDLDFPFTAATLLEDTPLEVLSGGKVWAPVNYDHTFRQQVTVRDALEQSINVPTVRAALQVGLPAVVDAARRCGIESPLEPLPSLALGAREVTPLELAGAYATFANGGWRVVPHALRGVVDRDGRPLGPRPPAPVRAVAPEVAYLVTDLLTGVMLRGTGRSAADLGFGGLAAGKTGTSDDLRDAWFVGFTPDLLVLVWVGYDDNRPLGLPGAAAALPIWVDVMNRIGGAEGGEFEEPAGLVRATIDPTSGGLATRRCPEERGEIFVDGTQPYEPCAVHGGGRRRGFWRRLFGAEEGED